MTYILNPSRSDIVSQNRGVSARRLSGATARRLAEGYLFLDWFAIPQITARLPGVHEEATKTAAARAVQSIPAYVEAADLFVALVPETLHRDRQVYCNYTAWLQRGWCRGAAKEACGRLGRQILSDSYMRC